MVQKYALNAGFTINFNYIYLYSHSFKVLQIYKNTYNKKKRTNSDALPVKS